MRTGTWARHRNPSVALKIVGAVLAVTIAVAAGQALFPHASTWLTVATSLGAGLVCGFAASRTAGAMRVAWLLFALAVVLYGIGNAIWIAYASPGPSPILSLADGMYLVALAPAALGLLVYPVLRGGTGRWHAVLLDALVLVLAVSSLSHTLALSEVFAEASTGSEALILGLYPLTDGLLMSLAVVLMLRSVGRPRLDVVLLALTFAVYAVSDSGYALQTVRGSDTIGTWVDLGYMVAPLPLAGAALVAALTPTPRRAVKRDLTGLAAPLLPDLTALLALSVALAFAWEDPVSRGIAVLLLVAVGIRQLVQTAASQDLRLRLEERIAARGREMAELAAHHSRVDHAKLEFITSVSHELRTPLTAIRGSLELLADGDVGRLSSRASSVVEVAVRGTQRLSRLVDDIIDLERLESGGFRMSPLPTEVGPLVEDAASALSPMAASLGVRLVVVAPGPASAQCDPDRVVQVLVNLLGNALKHAPEASDITVRVEERVHDVLVSVADAGRGIPDTELEAVFGRFHQVHPQRDLRQGGTGLGLAICKGIVEAHGGSIWVESGGGGATFRFTLPQPSRVDEAAPALSLPV